MVTKVSGINIKNADKKKKKFNLDFSTVATEDFGSITNVMCRMMYPQDTFKINVKQFTRLMPLVAPSYGKIDNITRGFTVPIEFVWGHFNKFLQNEVSVDGSPYYMPTFSPAFLLNRLIGRTDDTVIYEGNSYYSGLGDFIHTFQPWKTFLRPLDFKKFEPMTVTFKDSTSGNEGQASVVCLDSVFQRVDKKGMSYDSNSPKHFYIETSIVGDPNNYYNPQTYLDDNEKFKYCLFEINAIAYGTHESGSAGEDYRKESWYRDWYNSFHENNDYVILFDPYNYEGNEEFQLLETAISITSPSGSPSFDSIWNGSAMALPFKLANGQVIVTTADNGNTVNGRDCLYGIGLKLTRYGRLFFKRLHSLGYNFDLPHSSGWDLKVNSASGLIQAQRLSFLPLACQAKYYMDWIVPARWLKTLNYLQVMEIFESNWFGRDIYPTNMLSYNYVNEHPELMDLFNAYMFASSWFTDDYFMGCLPYPYVDPNIYPAMGNNQGQIESDLSSFGVLSTHGTVFNDSQPNQPLYISDNATSVIGLQTLGALTSMFNRGLLNGTKLQDWFVSEFGMRPSLDELHISHYWSSSQNDIVIGSIFAQSSSAEGPDGSKGNYLGEYAGHGVINTFDKGDGYSLTISNAKHHQFVFVTNEIMPRPFYFNGLRPEVSETGVFDLYTPNWDGIGMQAIPLSELINTVSGASANQLDFIDLFKRYHDQTFGFLPRYANWKVAFDNLLGDFRCNSLNTGLEAWYINRKFDHIFVNEDNTLEMISPNYMLATEGLPNNNSDRIFQYLDFDHFYSVYQISCSASRAMIPIANGVRFTESDGAVQSATDGSVE